MSCGRSTQSGAGYMGTSDGRDGWGQYFLAKGYAVYIMDQVGRGRSPYVDAVYGPRSMRSPKSVERDFIAYEKYNLFPQAKLHTQWPGSGTVGDPIFDQFMAETLPMIGDAKLREAVNRDATIALLDWIGPAILMPHSQSAAPAWLVADARPQLVKALLGNARTGRGLRQGPDLGPPRLSRGTFDCATPPRTIAPRPRARD
jgi:hypothetical protein